MLLKEKIPYPYQADILKESLRRTKCAFFLQMRLGKSPLTIWWLQQHRYKPKKILIICPKSTIVSWIEELDSFNINSTVLTTANKSYHQKFHDLTESCWCLTNYEVLRSNGMNLHNMQWDAVILDESQKIKNMATVITQLLSDPASFPSSNGKQLRAILSASPAPETMLEYFPQFRFLYGKMGQYIDFHKFRRDLFMTSVDSPGKYIPKPQTIPMIGNYINKNAYVLNRKQCGMDLPQVYLKRMVQLPDKFRKIYDEFESNWYSQILNDILQQGTKEKSIAQFMTQWATVAKNYLHQMACGYPKHEGAQDFKSPHKLDEVVGLLTEELRNEKVVIWCQYKNDMKALENKLYDLRRSGVLPGRAAVIRGGVTTEQLQHILVDFRTKDTDYLICQIAKGGVGMDFSVADIQIFFSRDWSSNNNQQATERLVHPNKKDREDFTNILTIDIITENTIDEDLHLALIEKKANANVYKWFLKRTKMDNPFGRDMELVA